MAQLLILKQDGPHFSKGDIAEIRASGTPFGGAEPQSFVLVDVPDISIATVDAYGNQHWRRNIQWEVVASDPGQDGYRIRLWSDVVAADGRGQLTREDVERFIHEWGGAVVSVSPGEVRFDVRIYDALVSPAFWDRDLAEFEFTELDYDQGTSIHRIQVDFSTTTKSPTAVERQAMARGAEIISHAGRVLVMEMDRADVLAKFIADIQRRGSRKEVARFRYRVNPGVVDAIVAQGGSVTTDAATVLSYIQDKAV